MCLRSEDERTRWENIKRKHSHFRRSGLGLQEMVKGVSGPLLILPRDLLACNKHTTIILKR